MEYKAAIPRICCKFFLWEHNSPHAQNNKDYCASGKSSIPEDSSMAHRLNWSQRPC